jgi:cell division protein FtsB
MYSDLGRAIHRKQFFKKLFYSGLLLLCLFNFASGLWYGEAGFRAYKKRTKAILLYQHKKQALETKLATIKDEIQAYEQDPFLVERFAREFLQMTRADEKLYIVRS